MLNLVFLSATGYALCITFGVICVTLLVAAAAAAANRRLDGPIRDSNRETYQGKSIAIRSVQHIKPASFLQSSWYHVDAEYMAERSDKSTKI